MQKVKHDEVCQDQYSDLTDEVQKNNQSVPGLKFLPLI